jgi:hypothetical protein
MLAASRLTKKPAMKMGRFRYWLPANPLHEGGASDQLRYADHRRLKCMALLIVGRLKKEIRTFLLILYQKKTIVNQDELQIHHKCASTVIPLTGSILYLTP